MRIALMQPYLLPYAGYFRLLSAVDLFIVYDDVQMPYPGWVHRNRFTGNSGNQEWFTTPLRKYHLGTKIKDIQFCEHVRQKWIDQLARFPHLGDNPVASALRKGWSYPSPCSLIMDTMKGACKLLNITPQIAYSSENSIRPDLKGQSRVIAICNHFKATEYINASGGVHLYSQDEFDRHGIKLKFLTDYQNKTSILERLRDEDHKSIRTDIDDHTRFQ